MGWGMRLGEDISCVDARSGVCDALAKTTELNSEMQSVDEKWEIQKRRHEEAKEYDRRMCREVETRRYSVPRL